MDVALDPDPLLFQPTRLANKISVARGFLSRVQRIWTELSQRQSLLKRELRGAELGYELEANELMAEDPEVAAGPSQGVKEAIVKRKLREKIKVVRSIVDALEDVEIVLKVASSKRTDLKDIQTRIRDQIKLCEEELGLQGRRWGQRGPDDTSGEDVLPNGEPFFSDGMSVTKRKRLEQKVDVKETQPETTPGTMTDLDDLLDEGAGENKTSNEALFPSLSNSSEVDAFLERGQEGPSRLEEEFSDLFNDVPGD